MCAYVVCVCVRAYRACAQVCVIADFTKILRNKQTLKVYIQIRYNTNIDIQHFLNTSEGEKKRKRDKNIKNEDIDRQRDRNKERKKKKRCRKTWKGYRKNRKERKKKHKERKIQNNTLRKTKIEEHIER